ncbi:MAG: hypothetical protein HC789_22240 [Microcoleus sp. CSU_2_2]|nr:hypothetical protein [Microcoleus sp. CSU_2_2]
MRRSFNLGLSARIIRGDAPYAPAHYNKGGNKPGFGVNCQLSTVNSQLL